MKDFILDITYKDATIVNSNDDIFTVPTNTIPNSNINHHSINLDKNNQNYSMNHKKNDKFSTYNLIDCL